MQKYLIIDGNSIGHFANNGKPLRLGNMPVQAIYNSMRVLRDRLSLFQNHKPIVLWDGASWRKMMFSSYKENRDAKDTKAQLKVLALKNSYKVQVPHIKKALRFLGVPQVFALNMEADDLGAILTDRYMAAGASEVVLLTDDQDWIQLVGPGVVWRSIRDSKKVITETNFEEMTGCKTVRQFIEVKALAGDAGDSIPGVGGIGAKGAKQFLAEYDSFQNFMNMVCIEKAVDFKKLPKKFQNLVINEEKAIDFARNIDLVDLRTSARPAPQGLSVDKGDPNFEKFHRFCEILHFQSLLQDLETWIGAFPEFRYLLEEKVDA